MKWIPPSVLEGVVYVIVLCGPESQFSLATGTRHSMAVPCVGMNALADCSMAVTAAWGGWGLGHFLVLISTQT